MQFFYSKFLVFCNPMYLQSVYFTLIARSKECSFAKSFAAGRFLHAAIAASSNQQGPRLLSQVSVALSMLRAVSLRKPRTELVFCHAFSGRCLETFMNNPQQGIAFAGLISAFCLLLNSLYVCNVKSGHVCSNNWLRFFCLYHLCKLKCNPTL